MYQFTHINYPENKYKNLLMIGIFAAVHFNFSPILALFFVAFFIHVIFSFQTPFIQVVKEENSTYQQKKKEKNCEAFLLGIQNNNGRSIQEHVCMYCIQQSRREFSIL